MDIDFPPPADDPVEEPSEPWAVDFGASQQDDGWTPGPDEPYGEAS